MAVAGGGWMSDYDTIPLGITPGTMPQKFTSYQRHVPSLMVGTAQEWEGLVMHMVDVAKTLVAGGVNPDGRQSDMLVLYELNKRDKARGEEHYVSRSEMADFTRGFMATSMSDGAADKFCSRYKNKMALHVSHHSVGVAKLDVKKRDEYMRQARKTFHGACLADARSEVESNAYAAPANPAVSTTSRLLQDFVDAKGIWPKAEERGAPSFFFDQQGQASSDVLHNLLKSAVANRAGLSVYYSNTCTPSAKKGIGCNGNGYVYSLPSDKVYDLYEGRLEWTATQFPELPSSSDARLAAIAKEGKFSCMTNVRKPAERVHACLEQHFPEATSNECYKSGVSMARLKEILLAKNANGHSCLNEPFRLLSGFQEASFKDVFRAEAEACVKHPGEPNLVNYTLRSKRPQPILEATFANTAKHMQKCVPFVESTPFSLHATKPAFFFSRFPDLFPPALAANYTEAFKTFSKDLDSERQAKAQSRRKNRTAVCSWHQEHLRVFKCYTALESVLYHAVATKFDQVYQTWLLDLVLLNKTI